MIGRTVGRYEILEKVGAGGNGIVHRAHDSRLEREVAIKTLSPERSIDDTVRERFRREARLLSRLNHPNIQTVYDFDSADGVEFMVSEYIPGISLGQRMGGEPIAEDEVLSLGLQLSEGLAAAHDKGVVHRDVAPENLRIMPTGQLKILDFGVAELVGPVTRMAETVDLDSRHPVTGTLPYMAPEQLCGDEYL